MPLYMYHANETCFSQSKSCTCQALLLERMLNIYEELFQDMMSEQKEDRSDLRHVMNEVKILRQKYTEEHNVWKELKEMNSVKVNINRKSCLHCEKSVHFQLLNCCLSYDIWSCDIIYDMVSNTNVCSHSHKVKNGTIRGGALNDFLMVFERAYTEKHKKF